MKAIEQTLLNNIIINTEKNRYVPSFPAFHKHNAYEIYILTEGTRYMCIGHDVYALCAGDASMLKPGVPHRSYGEDIYSGICIEFSDKTLANLISKETINKLLTCFEKPIISIGADLLPLLWEKALMCEFENGDKKELILIIAEILKLSAIITDVEIKRSLDSDMSPIGTYLQENFLTFTGLDELTERFRMTKSHLCHVFKKQTGMSVLQYVHRLKVQYACSLVQETDLSMREISAACGFGTVRYFDKLFKEIIGYTPMYIRQYVKKNKIYVREWDE